MLYNAKYAEVFHYFLEHYGAVALAVYRIPKSAQSMSFSWLVRLPDVSTDGDPLPYIVTNPPKDMIVFPGDRVFVLVWPETDPIVSSLATASGDPHSTVADVMVARGYVQDERNATTAASLFQMGPDDSELALAYHFGLDPARPSSAPVGESLADAGAVVLPDDTAAVQDAGAATNA